MKYLNIVPKASLFYHVFLHLALVLLAVEIIILARQNEKLKNQVGYAETRLNIGDQLLIQDVDLIDSSNESSRSSTRVVFLFTTTCGFCKLNLEQWEEITFELFSKIWVVGLSLSNYDDTKEYARDNQLQFSVYCARDPENYRTKYKLREVPSTILTDSSGQVLEIWRGTLSKTDVKAIIQAASIHFGSPSKE